MGLLTKEQFWEIIKERNMKTTSDISAMLRDLFSETMQEMLEAEMDTTLGYGKNENSAKQTTNPRNGHSKKTVVSGYGDSELLIPRDREGEHDPLIVKKHQKNLTDIEEQIIALYSKGMTVRDIQDHLNQLYGVTVSPTLISNVTNKLMPLILVMILLLPFSSGSPLLIGHFGGLISSLFIVLALPKCCQHTFQLPVYTLHQE